jgi:YD repeat-containing protein
VLRFTFEEDNEAHGVGFFSRGTNKNRFDDFVVWAASSGVLGADTSKTTEDDPTVTPDGDGQAVSTPDKTGTGAGEVPANNPPDSDVSPPDPAVIESGGDVVAVLGCGNCHTISGRDDATGQIGPPLDGVGDRAHTRIPGTPAEAYIRESILTPQAFIVDGFPAVMPSFEGAMSPDELDSLVAYLLSLSTGDVDEIKGVSDSLIGGRDVAEGRSPEHGPIGAVWIAEAGKWVAGGSGMTEVGGAQADLRLAVETGISHAAVSIDLTWNSGFAGLVTRYTDAKNWIMAWYDSSGFVIAIHSADGFEKIERIKFDWGDTGSTHNLKLNDYGDNIDFLVDDTLAYSFDPDPVPDSTKSGICSRGGPENGFTDFSVSESGTRPEALDDEPDAAPQGPIILKPQVVLPPDPALEPEYVEEWRERRKTPHLAGSLSNQGYKLEAVVDEGIAHPITLTFGDGVLYLASGELAELEKELSTRSNNCQTADSHLPF